MVEKIVGTRLEETEKTANIKNASDLAEALSLIKNTTQLDKKIREYSKALSSGEIISLLIQTSKYSGTQIIISVKNSESARKPDKELYLNNDETIAGKMAELGVRRNESRMFITDDLNRGGYAKLYRVLLEHKDVEPFQKLFDH